MEELVTVRITKPDNSVHELVYSTCEIRKIDEGILITRNCSRLVLAFYPINYSLEVIKLEIIDKTTK